MWNKLSDEKASKIIQALKNIILSYRELADSNIFSKPIPIVLEESNHYLCVLKKHKEIMICSTKITNNNGKVYNYNAILNADYLYNSLSLLEDSYEDMQRHVNILQKFPQTKWIELPFSQSFEHYCLSPNINPENFIKHMELGTLSDTYKQFLEEAGFALQNSTFSKELQDAIKEANDLFIER